MVLLRLGGLLKEISTWKSVIGNSNQTEARMSKTINLKLTTDQAELLVCCLDLATVEAKRRIEEYQIDDPSDQVGTVGWIRQRLTAAIREVQND